MEYPYIDLIPAIIKSHMPSVYEGESFTSLEYVSKVSHKMNEVVDEFNSFVKSVVEEVTTYKDCTDKDSDLFKRTIEQKFEDFTKVITLKYQSQDKVIVDAIAEMIDRLPEKLEECINMMYSNGEFDTIVYNSIEALKNDFDRIVDNTNTFQSNINTAFSNTLNDIEAFKSEIHTNFESLEAEFDKKFEDMQMEAQVADMQKSVYDTNDSGVVDNAEKLGGQLPSYYAKQQDLNTSNNNITTLSNNVSSINSQITTVQNTANTAKTIAEDAKTKADSLTTKINNAVSLANIAQTTADNAQVTADEAQSSANEAHTAANNAQSTAETAINLINSINANITVDILWENPAPTSSFTGKTINIDNSYLLYLCSARNADNGNAHDIMLVFPDGKMYTFKCGATKNRACRNIAILDGVVTFGNGLEQEDVGEAFTTSNDKMIPAAIIGIK